MIAPLVLALAAASCEHLASMRLPNGNVTSAIAVDAGAFVRPDVAGAPPPDAAAFAKLPAFCRVLATLTPSRDSDITIEVWLPASGWNGKFEGVGNGGWSGNIAYQALAAQLARGYATASTDTGHRGPRAQFALGHPEKVTDFAYRAVHEMTRAAKAIIAEYYGSAPRLSYWNGCSSGGKQGLKEAQMYPADYDGIVAGAPANYWTHLLTDAIWIAQATLKDPASRIPREKFGVIARASMAACDALDGVQDGVIADPTRCHFDPASIACKAGDSPDCLTPAQVAAVRKIYGPSKNPRTGATIFPGLEPGSESGWAAMAGGPEPFTIADDYFKYVVFKDLSWDFRTFDFDKDVAFTDRADGGAINATDPNLTPFFGRGGKILMYHGWADQLIAPQNSIDYLRRVDAAVGAARAAASIRLFMVPGMAHCGGGPGPTTFDAIGALETWVEQKRAPDVLPAAHETNGKPDRTRPICAYPNVATYNGSGDANDAANFRCRPPH